MISRNCVGQENLHHLLIAPVLNVQGIVHEVKGSLRIHVNVKRSHVTSTVEVILLLIVRVVHVTVISPNVQQGSPSTKTIVNANVLEIAFSVKNSMRTTVAADGPLVVFGVVGDSSITLISI